MNIHSDTINIKPSKLFEFINVAYGGTLNIAVDEFLLLYRERSTVDYKKNDKNKCTFSGTGKIKLNSNDDIDKLKATCTIDEQITLELINDDQMPDYYMCIGKNNHEECQNEIDGFDTIDKNVVWIWSSHYYYKITHKIAHKLL